MPLAATALTLLEQCRTNRDEYARWVHSRMLNTLIRHAPGPIYVSRAAQAQAQQLGLGDLRQFHWNDQIKRMGDIKR